MPGDISIETARRLDDETIEAFNRLLPQLSTSAVLDRDLLARLVEHEATTLFLARMDGGLVGALTLVIYPLPTGLRAHIDDVVVDTQTRGRGVGEALVRAAILAAQEQGARSIDLTSRPSREAAIRLYTRMGFEQRDSKLYRYRSS